MGFRVKGLGNGEVLILMVHGLGTSLPAPCPNHLLHFQKLHVYGLGLRFQGLGKVSKRVQSTRIRSTYPHKDVPTTKAIFGTLMALWSTWFKIFFFLLNQITNLTLYGRAFIPAESTIHLGVSDAQGYVATWNLLNYVSDC